MMRRPQPIRRPSASSSSTSPTPPPAPVEPLSAPRQFRPRAPQQLRSFDELHPRNGTGRFESKQRPTR